MTDFDHLIKEKAEQAQYKFRPSAWKSFLQYSGLKAGLAAWQIAAIITAAVVTGGAITYSVLKHSSSNHVTPEQFTEQVAADTVKEVIEMTEPLVEEITEQEPESIIKETSATIEKSAPAVTEEPAGEKITDNQVQVAKPKNVTTKRKKYYGRPVVIDVDTITVMHPTDEELKNGHSRLF